MFEIKLIKDMITQLLMGSYQVFDKIPQLKKKKKTMFRMLESFSSGKWFPLSTQCESGNYYESFMPLSILDVIALAKKKRMKVSVRTALALESFMIAN
jgi:hypothetical protein